MESAFASRATVRGNMHNLDTHHPTRRVGHACPKCTTALHGGVSLTNAAHALSHTQPIVHLCAVPRAGIYVDALSDDHRPLMITEPHNTGQVQQFTNFSAAVPPPDVFDVPAACTEGSDTVTVLSPAEWRVVVAQRTRPVLADVAATTARARSAQVAVELVAKHNAQPSRTYRLTTNHLAHHTFEDFRDKYLMQPAPRATVATMAAGASSNHSKSMAAAYTKVAATSSYDSRNHGLVTPVRDQGWCGSCWTFATTATLEVVIAKALGVVVPHLAPQALLDCCPVEVPGVDPVIYAKGCFGGWPGTAARFIQDVGGIPAEKDYPYQGVDGYCQHAKPWVAFPLNMSSWFIPPNSTGVMAAAVEQHGAITATIEVLPDFMFYQDGVYDNPMCGNEMSHAVSIIGYGASVRRCACTHACMCSCASQCRAHCATPSLCLLSVLAPDQPTCACCLPCGGKPWCRMRMCLAITHAAMFWAPHARKTPTAGAHGAWVAGAGAGGAGVCGQRFNPDVLRASRHDTARA